MCYSLHRISRNGIRYFSELWLQHIRHTTVRSNNTLSDYNTQKRLSLVKSILWNKSPRYATLSRKGY